MTLGSHQQYIGKCQVYITPKREILDELGPFETDPCTADPQPWLIGTRFNFTERDDGLSRPWVGRVFCNPPFDTTGVDRWVRKLATHNHGTLLIHVRPETDWFQLIWEHASAVLLLRKRVNFYAPDGSRYRHNSGAPVCLASFGPEDLNILRSCRLDGVLLTSWEFRPSTIQRRCA
jgi:DNA N-6-adenine-methyltransferase Dam